MDDEVAHSLKPLFDLDDQIKEALVSLEAAIRNSGTAIQDRHLAEMLQIALQLEGVYHRVDDLIAAVGKYR
jgi:hypothetical protein